MRLEVLRGIGKDLLREIKGGGSQKVLGTGAAGDKTYTIDRLAEEIILNGLKKSGLPLSVISEEAGFLELSGGGKKVLIDPIDGSKNAINGIPFYCASIAIADGDRLKDIELAYVINLINGDEFWAERSKGAFRNGVRISTSKDTELRLCAYEAQVPGKDIPKILPLLARFHRTRCFGATALDLAYLASGAISVFVTPALSRSFDFGGGWLLVKEAGGIITDISGSDISGIELGIGRASALLASANKTIHQKALRLLEAR